MTAMGRERDDGGEVGGLHRLNVDDVFEKFCSELEQRNG